MKLGRLSNWVCPNCGSKKVFHLNEKSEEYLRGNTHWCRGCDKILLIMVSDR